ncbi:MAG: hypothetical protein C5B55_04825 [Blastocatellia bacterium]|nr:MAG: hypothetical protein C5B55_04825 [Blastocatellia bacterium]
MEADGPSNPLRTQFTRNWDCTECGVGDIAFHAAFSFPAEVPEPNTLPLLGSGLAVLTRAFRRRHQSCNNHHRHKGTWKFSVRAVSDVRVWRALI